VSGLAVRILTAAALAPPVVLAILGGSPYVEVMVLAAGVIMAWEAVRTAWPERGHRLAATVAAVLGAAVLAAASAHATVAGVVLVGLVAAVAGAFRRRRGPILAAAIGYIGAACIAFLWLREQPALGLGLVLWLVGCVWATDIGALGFGRAIGGVRLAPALSPNKTWAGLLGGMACAALASVLIAAALPALSPAPVPGGRIGVAVAGAALGLAAQAGDLLESGYKRVFGVKDAGRIMPGHGGLLDRADGLLAATLALAIVVRMTQDTA
jgi:phosphatidate cytidylyltransferase